MHAEYRAEKLTTKCVILRLSYFVACQQRIAEVHIFSHELEPCGITRKSRPDGCSGRVIVWRIAANFALGLALQSEDEFIGCELVEKITPCSAGELLPAT
jgi:hypothetical protein